MKKLSLIAALTLSTILSACGGGGGGHGYIPPTTLPDNPNTPGETTNACATNPETCMTTQKFSNAEKRIELYQNAENQASTFSGRRMLKTAKNSDADSVSTAYNNMRTFFVDGNLSSATDETLLKSLLLAGFNKDDLPTANLKDWVEINANQIKNKAQTVWDMYGTEREVSIDNAKLNVVNIDAKQDSYVRFTVDSNGKIQNLHFDVDMDHADSRNMTLNRTGDGVFTRTGQMLIYGVKLENGNEVRLELFETPTDIEKLQNMLIAKMIEKKNEGSDLWPSMSEEEQEKLIQTSSEWIKKLTLDDFKGTTEDEAGPKQAYSEGGEAKTTVTYKSYAKDLNDKKGLQYADFGYVGIKGMEGNTEVNETFIVAGGMDAKRISKDDLVTLQQPMTFEGTAVAALNYQDYSGDKRVEHPKNYEGTANLIFDGGKETLTTDFSKDGWYNVVVTSNAQNDNYNIKFEGTPADSMYKFNNTNVNDFVGIRGSNSNYGAVDIGYYGDTKDNPTEATGYVAYGEQIDMNKNLHAQIGFGAVKK